MAYNLPKSYNLNIRLTSLVALFLSLLFISTDVNACCCGLSEVFNHFTRRFTNQRTDQGFAEVVLPPADTLSKTRPSGMHVMAASATERDKRIIDEHPAAFGETKTAAASETAFAPMLAQTPLTALIVDDEGVKLLESFLFKLGFAVTVLTSGEDAISFFDQGRTVDVVFMDYSMSGMTGPQATRSIREKHKELLTKFIIHSANGERDLREAMAVTFVNSEGKVRSLFDGRIPKGPDIDTLKAELVKHFLTDPSEGRKTKFIRQSTRLDY